MKIIIMNISIEKIKAFCRNSSLRVRSSKSISRQRPNQPPLLSLGSASLAPNLLSDYPLRKDLYLLIYVQSMSFQNSITINISNDQKVDLAVVKEGRIFYNGQETSIKVEKTQPFLIIFKFRNLSGRAVQKISGSMKTVGKVEIKKVKHFETLEEADKYVVRTINKQDTSNMIEVIRVDWNELSNKQVKDGRNSLSKLGGLRRLKSLNQRRSSHNTSISYTTNIPDERRTIKNIGNQFNTLDLDKYCRSYRPAKPFDKPKNYSQFIGKKQDYASLYKSLKHSFPKNKSAVSSSNPRSKEDIDKIYEEEKKRFNAPDPVITNESQVIEEDLPYNFRKYSDSMAGDSFQENAGQKNITQSDESGLAVSEYM